jgi:transcription elongation GreA/GreB family factor
VQRHPEEIAELAIEIHGTQLGVFDGADHDTAMGPLLHGPDDRAKPARRAVLELRIATAVLQPPLSDSDEVRFGATVQVRGEDGTVRVVSIVGVDEAEPAAGLLAFVAPLARALLGHRVGDM